MKAILQFISFAGLGCVIIPPILYLTGSLQKDSMQQIMLVGTLLWFLSVPLWMGKKQA
jgi:hypothetical protein